jgi:acetyl/propionyl-CoA carboxylase alpha subunit
VDAGVGQGSVVGLEYDPLLAKLIVLGPDRHAAIERAKRAVSEWVVLGVETNLPLLQSVLESPDFLSGRYATDLVAQLPDRVLDVPDAAWIAAALALTDAGGTARASGSREPWDETSRWRPGA